MPAEVRAARARLRDRLGRQGLLSLDPETRAVRFLARLDGFLTGPRAGDPATIVRDYVRAQGDVLGLDSGDTRALRVVDRGRSGGLARLVLTQSVEGIPLIDSGLRAHVTPDGRLLALTAACGRTPARDDTPAGRPRRGPRQGRARRGPAGAGYRASLIAYERGADLRLGWRVLVSASSTAHYDTIVDAQTGVVVRRVNRVKFGTAAVFENYPGAPVGGTAVQRDLSSFFYGPSPTRLRGPNAHAFVDHDDAVPGASFDTLAPPSGEDSATGPVDGDFDYPFGEFAPTPPDPDYGCSPAFRCSGIPRAPSTGSPMRIRRRLGSSGSSTPSTTTWRRRLESASAMTATMATSATKTTTTTTSRTPTA